MHASIGLASNMFPSKHQTGVHGGSWPLLGNVLTDSADAASLSEEVSKSLLQKPEDTV